MTSILSDSTNSEEEEDMASTVRQAYTLLVQNQTQLAIRMYTQCIEKYPHCWRAYQNLGVAYIMTRDFEKAYDILKKYVQHSPKDPLGHDSLGVSYSQLNDPLQAIACFVNAINLAPTNYMPYYNLGVVLGKLNLFEQALEVYKRCLQYMPSYINAMNNIADIHKRFNDIDSAINIFKQILQIDPTYILGIKNLGNCYLEKKQYFEALMTYLKFIDLNPNNQSILVNIALCLDHFQLYNEAANCLMKTYNLAQENNSDSAISKLYIAGNFFCRQLHKLNRQMRLSLKFRKNIPRVTKQKFFQTFMSATECYNSAFQRVPQYKQSSQNIQRTKMNLIGYKAKLGKAFPLLQPTNNYLLQFRDASKIFCLLKQQKSVIKCVLQWRRYMKRLVRKLEGPVSQKRVKYVDEKKKVFQMFNKTHYDSGQLHYKSRSYISRKFNHNLKRLILKRFRFTRKFKKFDCEFQKVFKYKKILTMLSDPEPGLNPQSQTIMERI